MGNSEELQQQVQVLRQQAENNYGSLLTVLMSLASMVETLSARDARFSEEYQSRFLQKVQQVMSTGHPSVVSTLLEVLVKTGGIKPS